MDYIDKSSSPYKSSKVFILPRTKWYQELEAKRLEDERLKKQEAEEVKISFCKTVDAKKLDS